MDERRDEPEQWGSGWGGFTMPDPVQEQPTKTTSSGFLLDSLRTRPAGRRILSGLIALLFLSGAGMFTYPFFTDVYTSQVIQQRLEDDYVNVKVKTFDEWQATVQDGRALTKIVMPALGVETLVVEGISPTALRAGAGHYPKTPLPGQDGNVAIAGHRTTYGKPFNAVDKLKEGDKILLLTPVGEFTYAVSPPPPGWNANPYITGPSDWSVIEPTAEPTLTLTTCHPKGSAAKRLVVRATLVSSDPPGTYAASKQKA
ncbi:MAG: class E sortase [Actinobacteria bacterium]|nr:class E sortase [Actinomycetota bacterium]